MNVYKQRLLNVARALRESPNPRWFSMRVYAHSCGTPACALGHYFSRPDLQQTFGWWIGVGKNSYPSVKGEQRVALSPDFEE